MRASQLLSLSPFNFKLSIKGGWWIGGLTEGTTPQTNVWIPMQQDGVARDLAFVLARNGQFHRGNGGVTCWLLSDGNISAKSVEELVFPAFIAKRCYDVYCFLCDDCRTWSAQARAKLSTAHASQTAVDTFRHGAVVLEHEGSKLQALDEAIRVGVVHVLKTCTPLKGIFPHINAFLQQRRLVCFHPGQVLVIDHNVVLCGHVVRNVVIHNEPQETVQQREVHFLRDVPRLAPSHHWTHGPLAKIEELVDWVPACYGFPSNQQATNRGSKERSQDWELSCK